MNLQPPQQDANDAPDTEEWATSHPVAVSRAVSLVQQRDEIWESMTHRQRVEWIKIGRDRT